MLCAAHCAQQAGKLSQEPPTLFPGSLASYVLVFQMDGEWHEGQLYYPKVEKGGKSPAISYGKLNMQPLVDKLRSADMIVRELYSSAHLCKEDAENPMPYFFALVSIGEKRQMTVAEIMGKSALIKLRMRKMDDIGLFLPPSACTPALLLFRALLACADSLERFLAFKITSTLPRTSQSWRECKPGEKARGGAASLKVDGCRASLPPHHAASPCGTPPPRHASTPFLHSSVPRAARTGNEIKNGGAWTTFKQHLSQYLEKSSEGTLFRSISSVHLLLFFPVIPNPLFFCAGMAHACALRVLRASTMRFASGRAHGGAHNGGVTGCDGGVMQVLSRGHTCKPRLGASQLVVM